MSRNLRALSEGMEVVESATVTPHLRDMKHFKPNDRPDMRHGMALSENDPLPLTATAGARDPGGVSIRYVVT